MLQPMAEVLDMEEEAMEVDILPKICTHCGKTWHTIDTCYKNHDFPPHFKFKNQNHDQSHTNAIFQNTNFNNNEQNNEGSKSEVESQQIGFTPKQYQTLLALLQQTKSSGNVYSQVSLNPKRGGG